jgi:hypothetical protein
MTCEGVGDDGTAGLPNCRHLRESKFQNETSLEQLGGVMEERVKKVDWRLRMKRTVCTAVERVGASL